MGSYDICGIISFRDFQRGKVTFIHVFQSTASPSEAQKEHPDAHARSYDHQQKGQTDPKLWTAEYWRWCCWLSRCKQSSLVEALRTCESQNDWLHRSEENRSRFPHWTLGGARYTLRPLDLQAHHLKWTFYNHNSANYLISGYWPLPGGTVMRALQLSFWQHFM